MTTHTRRAHETQTPLFITRVSDVQLAECPDDGGKWVIYCDHFDAQKREWYNAGMIQDSHKRRLASWCRAKRGAGFTTWCPECQVANDLYKKAGG
jgi:hypothetical protein